MKDARADVTALSLLGLLLIAPGDILAFKTYNVVCNPADSVETCTIDNVHIRAGMYQLNIFANQPGLVTTLQCTEDSNVRLHTLNEDICRQFPNLKELSLPAAGIRRITRGAFIHCHRLKTLRLFGNHLRRFPWTAFQGRRRSRVTANHLAYLDLQRNNLTDFRIEKFVKLFPHLYMVSLDENLIPDDRMDEIAAQLDTLYFDDSRNSYLK